LSFVFISSNLSLKQQKHLLSCRLAYYDQKQKIWAAQENSYFKHTPTQKVGASITY
jgi:hypothetical protein